MSDYMTEALRRMLAMSAADKEAGKSTFGNIPWEERKELLRQQTERQRRRRGVQRRSNERQAERRKKLSQAAKIDIGFIAMPEIKSKN